MPEDQHEASCPKVTSVISPCPYCHHVNIFACMVDGTQAVLCQCGGSFRITVRHDSEMPRNLLVRRQWED